MISKRILFDSHVHFYSCFSLEEFIYYSFKNFSNYSNEINNSNSFTAFMFITDGYEEGYQRIKKNCRKEFYYKDYEFFIESNKPDEYIKIRVDESLIYLIPGNQFITNENLEVLAIGKTINNYSKTDIISTINEFHSDFLVIIPWGFGKWLKNRGEKIRELLNKKDFHFLGDNGGINTIIKQPSEFLQAEELNIKILPGSDPLPIKSEIKRPGSFGFYTDEFNFDENNLLISLKSHLLNTQTIMHPFGKRVSFLSFIFNQFYMQILKYKK